MFIIVGLAMAEAFDRVQFNFLTDMCGNNVFTGKAVLANISKVQRCYQQICLVVDRFHQHFEWIYLGQIVFSFMGIINITFYIMDGVDTLLHLQNFIYWNLECVLRLWLITYIPDLIKNSVKTEFITSYSSWLEHVSILLLKAMKVVATVNLIKINDSSEVLEVNLQHIRLVLSCLNKNQFYQFNFSDWLLAMISSFWPKRWKEFCRNSTCWVFLNWIEDYCRWWVKAQSLINNLN